MSSRHAGLFSIDAAADAPARVGEISRCPRSVEASLNHLMRIEVPGRCMHSGVMEQGREEEGAARGSRRRAEIVSGEPGNLDPNDKLHGFPTTRSQVCKKEWSSCGENIEAVKVVNPRVEPAIRIGEDETKSAHPPSTRPP